MGEIVRYKRDVWGEEVILGVSWDLLWVVAVAVLVLLAAHAIVMAALAKKISTDPLLRAGGCAMNRLTAFSLADGRQHIRPDFYWYSADTGSRIAWLNIHWIAGCF